MIGNQLQKPGLELFEPAYLVTLDEIFHSPWVAGKRQRMFFLREAVSHFWPNGHPSRLIHVTGTNGKGSVIHYLEQGFPAKTGSWTGPHVFDYAERFHIGCKIVSHEEITGIYRETLLPYQDHFIKKYPGNALSFAELGILLALHLFEKYGVEWGIMEVGAGGRYTPLMVLDMAACILTNIGEDHPQTLGTEPWQRALEKAGIARPGIPFFTAAEEPTLAYVCKTAETEDAPVHILQQYEIDALDIPPSKEPGFKIRNLALACKVIRYFYPDADLSPGKMASHLPARFWLVEPNIIADMAHNVNKISKLVEQLKITYPGKKFRFLLGLSRSRDVREVFAPLLEIAEHIVMTGASYAGLPPAELAVLLGKDFASVEAIPIPAEAMEIEKKRLKPGEILVLTGSAYMIDQALNPNPYLKHLNATFGRRFTTMNSS
ncbi:MAG: dihydrofolate synthase / folylpolyglutamate synthase [Acidobacteriota bacterium]|nr:dihydrofolate synthase / folylpolyglutamate synthase [Acidobacteriota bacterium]